MSLYYDAAAILNSENRKGSLKSLIYAKDSNLRSKPAHVYALIAEVAKYDTFLKEVIDNALILAQEPKLTPTLALLLAHDHFFAKGGIAAAAAHPLRQCIEKHKARLQSEFTRARLRRKVGSIDQLKKQLVGGKDGKIARPSPRWARVNLIEKSLDEVLKDSFGRYSALDSIQDVVNASSNRKVYYIDHNIPNLLAFRPTEDLTKTEAYAKGWIILQDKASCFPAHLLLGDSSEGDIGGVVDGCAAPGNKTTHAAAIVTSATSRTTTVPTIYGCERDLTRSKTLQMMVNKAGASNIVTVLEKQDFLALNPDDERFANVTHLLLDPSCSGSGILGREDIPKLDLPSDPRQTQNLAKKQDLHTSKKRKRKAETTAVPVPYADSATTDLQETDSDPNSEAQPMNVDSIRLEKLSTLQSLIVEHAFRFPAATRVTYSTCSIHTEENEAVVARVLNSEIAQRRGWRVLRRNEQVRGMKTWERRGVPLPSTEPHESRSRRELTSDQIEACIRCSPGDAEGTMGFFVAGFVRDGGGDLLGHSHDIRSKDEETKARVSSDEDEDAWEGFSDD